MLVQPSADNLLTLDLQQAMRDQRRGTDDKLHRDCYGTRSTTYVKSELLYCGYQGYQICISENGAHSRCPEGHVS